MQIHAAAKRGDIGGLKYCLSRGVPVDQRGFLEDTPLFAVLDWRWKQHNKDPQARLETLRYLLEAGADPNASDKHGTTPLHRAVASGSPNLVRCLYKHGADPHRRSNLGSTTMRSACCQRPSAGKFEIIRFLAECGVSLDDATAKYHETPLGICFDNNDAETVRLLLDLGASPAPLLEWSELHRLVVLGSLAELKERRITAIELNQKSKRWELTPLMLAVNIGDVGKLSYLTEIGAPLTQLGRLNMSPLHIAAKHNRAEVTKWLLERGAAIERANEFNETPLMVACQHGATDTVVALLDAGAAIEANGKQAINQAHSKAEVIKLLVEQAGANVNSVDDCGDWPLKELAAANDYVGCEWLLAHGAHVDLTSTGGTALHAAIFFDAREAAQVLLQHGADPNRQDVDGQTPLFNACSREAIQLLLSHGADSKISDQSGNPPTWRMDDPLLREML